MSVHHWEVIKMTWTHGVSGYGCCYTISLASPRSFACPPQQPVIHAVACMDLKSLCFHWCRFTWHFPANIAPVPFPILVSSTCCVCASCHSTISTYPTTSCDYGRSVTHNSLNLSFSLLPHNRQKLRPFQKRLIANCCRQIVMSDLHLFSNCEGFSVSHILLINQIHPSSWHEHQYVQCCFWCSEELETIDHIHVVCLGTAFSLPLFHTGTDHTVELFQFHSNTNTQVNNDHCLVQVSSFRCAPARDVLPRFTQVLCPRICCKHAILY